jgi:hypothetical protein
MLPVADDAGKHRAQLQQFGIALFLFTSAAVSDDVISHVIFC